MQLNSSAFLLAFPLNHGFIIYIIIIFIRYMILYYRNVDTDTKNSSFCHRGRNVCEANTMTKELPLLLYPGVLPFG